MKQRSTHFNANNLSMDLDFSVQSFQAHVVEHYDYNVPGDAKSDMRPKCSLCFVRLFKLLRSF